MEGTAFQQLGLEPAEKGLHMRIIVRIIGNTHVLEHFFRAIQYLPELSDYILASEIRMNHQVRVLCSGC